MSKTLVINGADYSSVALDVVTIESDPVPCTGISLSANTASATRAEDTVTITATPTPSNTTDSVVWTSSDSNVASVSGGVITIHGIGTATITATCGSYSATVSVNQTTIKQKNALTLAESCRLSMNATDGYPAVSLFTNSSFTSIGQAYSASDTTLQIFGGSARGIELIPVPYGATSVIFETTTRCGIDDFVTADTNSMITYEGNNYAESLVRTKNSYSDTGIEVAYGQGILVSVTPARTDYITDIIFS